MKIGHTQTVNTKTNNFLLDDSSKKTRAAAAAAKTDQSLGNCCNVTSYMFIKSSIKFFRIHWRSSMDKQMQAREVVISKTWYTSSSNQASP